MVIDGRKIRDEIKEQLKEDVKNLHNFHKDLRLAIVLVGENPASLRFIEEKKKFGREIGVDTRIYKFDEAVSTTALRDKLAEIVHIKQNTGVIIQLPLPPQINVQYILNSVPPEKDIDVLSSRALGDFYVGRNLVLPPVVGAINLILSQIFGVHVDENLINKNIVILGAGRLVGKPLVVWFVNLGGTVSVLNKNTPDISKFTKEADILISGVGKPKFITANMIKENVIVLDCGTSVEKIKTDGDEMEKYSGDVDFDEVQKKAAFITPVPGGVGPITVAMLFKNLVELTKKV